MGKEKAQKETTEKKKTYVVIGNYVRGEKLKIGSDLELTDKEAKPLLALKKPPIRLKDSSD